MAFSNCRVALTFLASSIVQAQLVIVPCAIPGVMIEGPDSAQFKAQFVKEFPTQEKQNAVALAVPYSVVVENRGTRSITEFMVSASYTGLNGQELHSTRTIRFPKGSFAPAQSRMAMSFPQTFHPKDPVKASVGLSRLTRDGVRVAVEYVIFDDGEFAGGGFEKKQHDILRKASLLQILKSIDVMTEQEILAHIEAFESEEPVPLGLQGMVNTLKATLNLADGKKSYHWTLDELSLQVSSESKISRR
jgi:hypothetical protein